MLFQRIYDEGLSQASHFIGCQKQGVAVLPRDVVNAF